MDEGSGNREKWELFLLNGRWNGVRRSVEYERYLLVLFYVSGTV